MEHRIVLNSPQLNEVAKLMNEIILERARFLLSNIGLDEDFWAKALNTNWKTLEET